MYKNSIMKKLLVGVFVFSTPTGLLPHADQGYVSIEAKMGIDDTDGFVLVEDYQEVVVEMQYEEAAKIIDGFIYQGHIKSYQREQAIADLLSSMNAQYKPLSHDEVAKHLDVKANRTSKNSHYRHNKSSTRRYR